MALLSSTRYIGVLDETRGTDTPKHELSVAGVGDALTSVRGYSDHVAGTDVRGWKIADFNASKAAKDEVAFLDPPKVMPLRRHAGRDACARDGCVRVALVVGHFEDPATFRRQEF